MNASATRVNEPAPTAGSTERNIEAMLAERIAQAAGEGRPLRIGGGGSKAFYGNPVDIDDLLDVTPHTGVVAYEPTELAITVRAGTPLKAVEALLDANGQQLPFEPPRFGPGATIGGAVATGLSGPRRPYAASVRDALLGVRVINGRGQVLEFGGRVMKNVAGYDVSRLMAGSLGVLAVLSEVSIKVMPKPVGKLTLVREEGYDDAMALLRRWARHSLTLTATAWHDGRLYARLCGSEEALVEGHRVIGGAPADEGDDFWDQLREQRLGFFGAQQPLWRLSLPPAAARLDLQGDPLIEWAGALRWLFSDASPDTIRAAARQAGGHATLFRMPPGRMPATDSVFTPLTPVVLRLHRRLKAAFDPEGILNPGRLYPEI